MPHPSFPHRLYRGLSRMLPRAARLAGGYLAEQTGAARRWASWAETDRPEGPLLWVHGASVGELLTAAPVIRRLTRRMDALAVVYSHTSRSVAQRPWLFPSVRRDYVPHDTTEDTARTLEAVRPDCLLLARGDLWPELMLQAAQLNIPIAVLGGQISRRSFRHRQFVRSLYAPSVGSVSWIGAVSSEDAERWCQLGARREVIEVTGDPRHDEVLERLTDLPAITPYRAWAAGGSVLVAGSVEPADVGPVFAAWRVVRDSAPDARLLVVPHDPSAALLARITRLAGRSGEPALIGIDGLLASPERSRCAVHDSVGTLPDLYALATVAYVGGGFARRTLHSVVEPAALAVPVLAGRHAADSRDARVLRDRGGLVSAGGADMLGRHWLEWVSDPDRRMQAGIGARRALSSGAADRSAAAVLSILMKRGGAPVPTG